MKTSIFQTVKPEFPLIDSINQHFRNADLNDVILVAAQHILPTVNAMIQSLIENGLNKENVFIIGKCYSSFLNVYDSFIRDGIYVHPKSIEFNSSLSFDDQYKTNIKEFLEIVSEKSDLARKTVVILDDGGELILQASKHKELRNKSIGSIVGVEQTSAGYHKLLAASIDFPIMNAARSYLKLNYESNIIAEITVRNILSLITTKLSCRSNILITGAGAIGNAVCDKLISLDYLKVDIFDINEIKSSLTQINLNKRLPYYDLIIGATGTTSIPSSLYSNLKKGVYLASASSSDREFDAVQIRNAKKIITNDPSINHIQTFRLLNDGFPINFSGLESEVDPPVFDLTRSILLLAIYQGLSITNKQIGFIELNEEIQKKIAKLYKSNYCSTQNSLVS